MRGRSNECEAASQRTEFAGAVPPTTVARTPRHKWPMDRRSQRLEQWWRELGLAVPKGGAALRLGVRFERWIGATAILSAGLLLFGCAGDSGSSDADGSSSPTSSASTSLKPAADPARDLRGPAGPDRIAFTRTVGPGALPMLWTGNIGGTDLAPVGDQQGWWPDWSPDRTLLVFDFSTDSSDDQIATIRPDGSELSVLTEAAGYNEAPDYSPDGNTIIYAHSKMHEDDPGFRTGLWLMNADGSKKRPLPLDDGGGDDTEAEYSPDGTQIVFVRLRHDKADTTAAFVAAADGSDVRRLTGWLHKVEHPRWSPDGQDHLQRRGSAEPRERDQRHLDRRSVRWKAGAAPPVDP